MIAVITTPHWGDLILLAILVTLTAILIYLGCRLVDLAIDAMRRPARRDFARHADDARRLADAGREIPPEDEPSWPGKAPVLVDPSPAPFMTSAPPLTADNPGLWVLAGHLPEKPAETSQPRHSADDTVTELFPVVVDGPHAMDVVAAVVSGQDSTKDQP